MDFYNGLIINGHIIVEIDSKKYLIDTGSVVSFSLKEPHFLKINDRNYFLNKINMDLDSVNKIVGFIPDGFIGMDILETTNLAVEKNGDNLKIHFDIIRNATGLFVDIYKEGSYYYFNIVNDNSKLKYCIDLGAMYPYGIKNYFDCNRTYKFVYDYNPMLGNLTSSVYKTKISIETKIFEIEFANNQKVIESYLGPLDFDIIGSINDFYQNYFVLDFECGLLILN